MDTTETVDKTGAVDTSVMTDTAGATTVATAAGTIDRSDPRVAWLADALQELQTERAACEQRIVEIDRVMGAAQIMLDELTREKSVVSAPLLQAGTFPVAPTQPHKPSRVYPRVQKPKPAKGRIDKPNQADWLARWAREHGGIVRISEVRPAFIAARMTDAKPRNIYGNIFGIMKRSEDFEQIGTGMFRWIPYEPPAGDDETTEATRGDDNETPDIT